MLDAINVIPFIFACLLLNILPGPDSLYIIARSATQGGRAGVVALLGIMSGVSVHIVGAALGLSALLATSAWAFTLIKVAGCVYLLYLGFAMLMAKRETSKPETGSSKLKPASLKRIFTGGFLTNVLNPKVALFFLAFVPQFIPADVADKTQMFLALGGIFTLTGTSWCLLLVIGTVWLRNRLAGIGGLSFWLNKAAGGLFVFFAVKLGLASA
ncbi:LysE family translocator [Alteromonas lipolytica]|uniref:Lysine transporter LysE n=1 Tax=Alteromonas lipolytica TaxID=1856405 RepID=A0A1E8F8B4_9ALTE|nr:LysE family translocator [Alteromonas lipolytica]OFI32154.1 hypothetical protein BFC17_07970 [Alteromonas lipolytica]GGF83446.1 lysine transporter LysE [Alteromonas lipolytica]